MLLAPKVWWFPMRYRGYLLTLAFGVIGVYGVARAYYVMLMNPGSSDATLSFWTAILWYGLLFGLFMWESFFKPNSYWEDEKQKG